MDDTKINNGCEIAYYQKINFDELARDELFYKVCKRAVSNDKVSVQELCGKIFIDCDKAFRDRFNGDFSHAKIIENMQVIHIDFKEYFASRSMSNLFKLLKSLNRKCLGKSSEIDILLDYFEFYMLRVLQQVERFKEITKDLPVYYFED